MRTSSTKDACLCPSLVWFETLAQAPDRRAKRQCPRHQESQGKPRAAWAGEGKPDLQTRARFLGTGPSPRPPAPRPAATQLKFCLGSGGIRLPAGRGPGQEQVGFHLVRLSHAHWGRGFSQRRYLLGLASASSSPVLSIRGGSAAGQLTHRGWQLQSCHQTCDNHLRRIMYGDLTVGAGSHLWPVWGWGEGVTPGQSTGGRSPCGSRVRAVRGRGAGCRGHQRVS